MRVKKQGFRPAAWLGVQLINKKGRLDFIQASFLFMESL